MKFKKLVSGAASLALSLSGLAGISHAAPANTLKASAAATNWKFDFGGSGAASGYTGVSATDGYNASRGYGFAQTGNVTNVSAGGTGVTADAVKFNNYGSGNTFNVDLPKGLYEVTVTIGNAPRTSIKMEGMFQMMNLTGRGAKETVQLPVTDGQLNIQAVEGMTGREQSISAVEITQLNTTGVMPPTVWICGDSTVANYYNTADTAQHGWGQFFGGYVSGAGYKVRNMATSGQYAKGFYDGGQFAPIEAYGKSGDYFIVSIGINDINYSNASEYHDVVTTMVKKAKAKGMEVILVKQQGRRGDLTR
ncbi:MAG: GDSL family lipase, partial [Ruminococcus sp.]|nr:GDSL family lipase [Ruminococcus sp.]